MKVIAGHSHGVEGTVQRPVTQPIFLDIVLAAGASFSQQLPPGHNAFIYVYRGAVSIGDKAVPCARMAILSNAADADGVRIEAREESRVILIAGHPLGEPIAQHGPFVMNTQEEIRTAIDDFRAGRLGE